MHVLSVGFNVERAGRDPDEVFHTWPTLTHVGEASATAGVHVTVLQASQQPRVVEHRGVTCHFVKPATLAGHAASLKAEVLHVHGLCFPLHTRLLAERTGRVPIVLQSHADRPPAPWRTAIHRWGLRHTAAVICTERSQMDPFIQARLLPRSIQVFELAGASSRFTPGSREEARKMTGVFGDPSVLWVGRLEANKDPLTILEAVSRVTPQLPDLQLWCCYGDAPLLPQVHERLAADPALAERVHLLGPVSHPRVEQLNRAADFFVLGSHHEGGPFSVIEALACGATPIVTDIPAMRALTGNGAVGALFPPGDAEALARALVVTSARDRHELRTAARAHFDATLSFHALGHGLRRVYDTVVRT
jgi:glycosyltransferase involved in cell wall biosynthesis